MKRCPQCGGEYEDRVRFCPRDGQTLNAVSSESSLPTEKLSPEAESKQSDPLIGRVLAGRYRLLTKLGQGGMGAVYKGEHIKMNRLTAIKVLTSELASNPEFVARFEREAEMASHIDHPHAVGIYDFGEAEEGIVYLAMEFVDGQPLSNIIRREGVLSLERTVSITRQAAEGLNAAHQLGIVHRDFKPDNVMVCKKGGHSDWVEVVDFGIAKRAEAEPQKALTQAGFVLGTPQYMSPEQVSGEPLDLRSDLYSLALVTYEMLTGALPFAGSTLQSQMVKRLVEPPRPLSLVRPQLALPPAIEPVIMKALARNPDDRYGSTVEFAAALEAAARDQAQTQPVQPRTMPQRPAEPTRPPMQAPTTPPFTPVTQPPYQQTPTPVQTPMHTPMHTPMQTPMPPYPSYYSQAQPAPRKSRTGVIVLIIILVILGMMGACVTMLAIIGSNPETSRKESNSNLQVLVPNQNLNANQSQADVDQGLNDDETSPATDTAQDDDEPSDSNANESEADAATGDDDSSSKVVRRSAGVLQGEAIKQVQPLYPPLARAARVSGPVVVEVTIDEEGNVIDAKAISGHPLLRKAAIDAARGWEFKPSLLNGVPVTVVGTITFNFEL